MKSNFKSGEIFEIFDLYKVQFGNERQNTYFQIGFLQNISNRFAADFPKRNVEVDKSKQREMEAPFLCINQKTSRINNILVKIEKLFLAIKTSHP